MQTDSPTYFSRHYLSLILRLLLLVFLPDSSRPSGLRGPGDLQETPNQSETPQHMVYGRKRMFHCAGSLSTVLKSGSSYGSERVSSIGDIAGVDAPQFARCRCVSVCAAPIEVIQDFGNFKVS